MFTVAYKVNNEIRTLDFKTMEEAVKCDSYLKDKFGPSNVKIHADTKEGGFAVWKPKVFEFWLQKELNKAKNKTEKQQNLEKLFG